MGLEEPFGVRCDSRHQYGSVPRCRWCPGMQRKIGDEEDPHKLGSILCSHAIRRASSVVTNGFLLTCTNREAPRLSFRIIRQDFRRHDVRAAGGS